MAELSIAGMELAEGVVETIVALAVKDVEGVANLGGVSGANAILATIGSIPPWQGIEARNGEEGLVIDVHVDVHFGHVLPTVADAVRAAAVDAVRTQVGVPVERVDVYIDNIQFA